MLIVQARGLLLAVRRCTNGFNKWSKQESAQRVCYATSAPSGALLPEPAQIPFGLLGLLGAVIPGLLLGAAISKNIANFLEENELFVPSDDDDDDD